MDGVEQEDDVVSINSHTDLFAEENGPPKSLKKLEKDLQDTQARSYSAGTLKNLCCQWRAFRHFVVMYGLFFWPVPEHIMCLFAQYLAYTFHSANAIKNYLFGIRTIHTLLRAKPPCLQDIEVKITVLGIKKKLKRTRQAFPLNPDILLNMVPYLDLTKHTDLVFWGFLITGFFTFFRKSNLLAYSFKWFDPNK